MFSVFSDKHTLTHTKLLTSLDIAALILQPDTQVLYYSAWNSCEVTLIPLQHI